MADDAALKLYLSDLTGGIADAVAAEASRLAYHVTRRDAGPIPTGAVGVYRRRGPWTTPALTVTAELLGEADAFTIGAIRFRMDAGHADLLEAMIDDLHDVFELRPAGSLGGVTHSTVWRASGADLGGDGSRFSATENYQIQLHRETPHRGDN